MFVVLLYDPPNFYPAHKHVKAGKNGWGLAYTGLYGPFRAYTRGKNQVDDMNKISVSHGEILG